MKFKRIIWKSLKVFFVLCVVAGICIVMNFKGQKQVQKNEQEADTNIQEIAMIQNEIETSEVMEMQSNTENIINESVEIQSETKQESTIEKKTEIVNSKPVESKIDTVQTTNAKVEETPVQVNTPVEEIKKEETPQPTKQETPTEIKQETKKEELKINNVMINKIKNIINSNPSETMQQYGYNIITDSSITTQTNQFTFTEQRVKDKINYKFGTIKIYAQDYYVNGELVWTECYII